MRASILCAIIFVVSVKAKDAIDFNCTAAPLGVDYAFIKHYSGRAACDWLSPSLGDALQ
jgi:hypothetical protein